MIALAHQGAAPTEPTDAASARVRAKVYDPVLRVIHATNALAVLALLASGMSAWLLEIGAFTAWLHALHVWPGYLLTLGLVARLIWGSVGPWHARLTRLWNPLAWRAALATGRLFSTPTQWGHHPPATLAYVLAYGLLVALAASGLSLLAIQAGAGPLNPMLGFEVDWLVLYTRMHVWASHAVLAFVALHLAALALHRRRHRLPLAQAMLSGYQYLPRKP
jgi:cytochrome b